MTLNCVDVLDQSIVADPRFDDEWYERSVATQHELGLVYGKRPTCPFLRPHIITRAQYEAVKTAAEVIAKAFETVVAKALEDPVLLQLFNLTARETEIARVDPGYRSLCVTSRLDSSVTSDGFMFLEYNAENPAGVGDQMQLEQILLNNVHIRDFLERNPAWLPRPHRQLLRAMVAAYQDHGGQEQHPQIAIVDWRGVATASEFQVLRQYFEQCGHSTVIADPEELQYDGESLRVGKFRVDILYKRVVIHEFLTRCDEDHALVRAYRDGRICMVNSFRSKVAHKKAGFAVLSDPAYEHLFRPEETAVFRQHIPWTRVVKSGVTTYQDDVCELVPLIERNRERFVLKPNDDYGGHGVVLGWETEEADWKSAIAIALQQPYVVQERVKLEKILIPMFSEGVKLQPMYVDFNPFLFNNEVEGALVRLSASPLLNVTAGGGQTALLVLE